MKNYIRKFSITSVLPVLLFGFLLTGCDEDTTDGYTDITYYATLELEGETTIILDKGSSFEEPGYLAELNGEDVTEEVDVVSNVNTSETGIYSINYTVTNDDGFSSTKSRTIYVKDPTPSAIRSGIYTTAEGTHRVNQDNGAVTAFNGQSVIILQMEPGVFYISDFIGGYYDQYVGYGSSYAMAGHFQLNEDNTITVIDNLVPGWGDSMDEMTTSSVDPETDSLSWSLLYAGFLEFNVILN